MNMHVTNFRNQIFKVLQSIDEGADVTIIKKDTNKRYKIVPVKGSPKKDIVKIAKEMGNIGFKAPSMKEMKRIFESRYE